MYNIDSIEYDAFFFTYLMNFNIFFFFFFLVILFT